MAEESQQTGVSLHDVITLASELHCNLVLGLWCPSQSWDGSFTRCVIKTETWLLNNPLKYFGPISATLKLSNHFRNTAEKSKTMIMKKNFQQIRRDG